jgi:MarR family transcriptional repressor of emrRAB
MSFEERIDRICAAHPEAPRDLILASRLLMRSARLLRHHIDAALVPFDLNMSQYLVLSMLSTEDAPPPMPSELSATIDATRTQMTRLLDALEGRGLLRRDTVAHDRRSLALSLTPAGHALLERAQPAVHAAYGTAWAPVGAAGLASAAGALDTLHQSLSRAYPGQP